MATSSLNKSLKSNSGNGIDASKTFCRLVRIDDMSPITLFLDFDGVLHPEPCFDRSRLFCQLPVLEAVLRDFPEVDIVISSSWRELLHLDDLKSLFSGDIAWRIVGVTPRFH